MCTAGVQWWRKARERAHLKPLHIVDYFTQEDAAFWATSFASSSESEAVGKATPQLLARGEQQALKYESFLHNSMTWQFGDYFDVRRRRLSNVTAELALERAKAFLRSMDHIGFYEDLGGSYRELKRTVIDPFTATFQTAAARDHDHDGDGGPSQQAVADAGGSLSTAWHGLITWTRHLLFYLGTVLGRHRIKVLKYSAMLSETELALVRRHNALDLQLYEYALELTGRSEPIGAS